jgi:hypothetical protein
MSTLLDPELFSRLEADVAAVVQKCKTLAQENELLSDRYAALQREYQQLQQRNQNAVSYAKALLEQLTSAEVVEAYEHNQ